MTSPATTTTTTTAPTSDSRIFSIEGRGLTLTTAEDIKEWIEAIHNVQDLEEIRLNGNTIGVEAAEALAQVLNSKPTLRVVKLNDIFTGRLREEVGRATKVICDAIKDHENLEVLDLSDNAFGPTGADAMYDLLATNGSLKALYLSNTGLGIQGGKTIAKALMRRHEKNIKEGKSSNLRKIFIGRNRLENGSSQELSDVFASIGTLTEVHMPQNGIRPEGIAILVEGLAKSPGLEVLNLQDNTFTESGSLALAGALSKWNNLRHLDVGDSLLGARGGLRVIETLRVSTKLSYLNLQYNEIEQDGANKLAEVLPLLTKLEVLELNGNRFEGDGEAADNIRSALAKNDLEHILGSLSDMEELTEDEEEEEEEEEEESSKLNAQIVETKKEREVVLDKEAEANVEKSVQGLIDQITKSFGLN
ncbi:Ran GAP Rna1 [Spiromyces aspiralis]|uniref:Ran GAP Rna1 n=1 Tax=Spiromyces aspiralis TaxID=68401 RepID=A0ACC1HF34_9FUNG|nr:Ran GAP Rna1 [Spiromyces aspiralis]